MISVENLVREFNGPNGSVKALDSVSFTVEKGEFIAIQGPSGCGKSTLLLTAGGMLSPSAGTAAVNGTDLYSLSANKRSRFRADHIGFVFQEFYLIPYLSVRDNILAADLAHHQDAAGDIADELIGKLGLAERKDHVPSQLSSGESQRTALARAFLNNPSVILADEPTGNLDRENAKIVLDSLADFAAKGGSVLLVTHDDYAAEKAGEILKMEKGRIV